MINTWIPNNRILKSFKKVRRKQTSQNARGSLDMSHDLYPLDCNKSNRFTTLTSTFREYDSKCQFRDEKDPN